MSMSEFHSQMEAAGHTVVTGKKYIVIDYGNRKDGVNDDGDPIARSENSVAYIPKGRTYKVFHGQTKDEINEKIAGNAPDFERSSIVSK